jgi:hypothetical protein
MKIEITSETEREVLLVQSWRENEEVNAADGWLSITPIIND